MKVSICFFVSIALILASMPAGASQTEAEALFRRGGLDNLKQAAALYRQAADSAPQDYGLQWKAARALREYGDLAKREQVQDWREVCAETGRAGMKLAARAVALEPDKADGHYYYGLCVGIYSDGVSVFTALREGLKNETQKSFEKAYALDRTYNRAGPILSLGRFWAVLPWPLHDRKKALAYFREYQKTPYFEGNTEACVYLGELLQQIGGAENRREAERWLKKALAGQDPYYRDWARRLLEK